MVLSITTLGRSTNQPLLVFAVVLVELVCLRFTVEAKPLIAVIELSGERNDLKPQSATSIDYLQQELLNVRILRKGVVPVLDSRTIHHHQQQEQEQQDQQHQQNNRRGYSSYNSGVGGGNHGNGFELLGKLPDTRLLRHQQQPTPATNLNNTSGRSSPSLPKALLGLQNPRLFGGDILIRTGKGKRRGSDHVIERSALVSAASLWPSGVIFYEMDESVAHLAELILKVMQQFHDNTCIKFMPREHNEPDYLRIEALRGCFSYIGRIGGEQTLSLGDGCEYRGTIAHELMHAVGFYHHQNRSDRDDFLEILWENIAKGKETQFRKMAPLENLLLNKFDYESIMLYGPRTFGKTLDRVTMKPKREGIILLEVAEKQGLSSMDIDSVNKLYKCNEFKRR